MKIWKYVLPFKDEFSLSLPVDSRIIALQVQNNKPCIWVLFQEVNSTEQNPLVERFFSLTPTGQEIDRLCGCSFYIGTVQLNEGKLVLHLFEDIT
jgi:hypothetical protein